MAKKVKNLEAEMTSKLERLEKEVLKRFNSFVAFQAQRFDGISYLPPGTIIPYQWTLININNALDVKTGVFKAPIDGIYYFYFTAIKAERDGFYTDHLQVELQLNGTFIAESNVKSKDRFGLYPVYLQATVKLKAWDNVGVVLIEGGIHEEYSLDFEKQDHGTEFIGFLIEPLHD